MFHTHSFTPLTSNEHFIYCSCGDRHCIHEFEVYKDEIATYTFSGGNVRIITSRCKHCGKVVVTKSDD